MSATYETPIGDVANPCLCCPSKPGVLPLDYYPHPGFGSLDLTCDGNTADGWWDLMDWGYWTYLDGSRGGPACTGYRDDLFWSTAGERVTLRDIEEAVALDPDHDWRLEIHGPMYGVIYQRQGCAQWVAIEKLNGFA